MRRQLSRCSCLCTRTANPCFRALTLTNTLQSTPLLQQRALFTPLLSLRDASGRAAEAKAPTRRKPGHQQPSKPPSQNVAKEAAATLPAPAATIADSVAQGIRLRAPKVTETYVAYGTCELLVKECARVADYEIPTPEDKDAELPKNDKGEDVGIGKGWWYEDLGLVPTFNTWAQITFLHMYVLTVRLRCFPKEHAPAWHQHLTDHFFYMAEDRMATVHRIHARSVRSRYLKELFSQWRGIIATYDEGLVKGDAVLATAVWRNIFKAAEDVDFVKLAQIVSYIRSTVYSLSKMDDGVIASADVIFSDPSSEAAIVQECSMDAGKVVLKPQKEAAKPLNI